MTTGEILTSIQIVTNILLGILVIVDITYWITGADREDKT